MKAEYGIIRSKGIMYCYAEMKRSSRWCETLLLITHLRQQCAMASGQDRRIVDAVTDRQIHAQYP